MHSGQDAGEVVAEGNLGVDKVHLFVTVVLLEPHHVGIVVVGIHVGLHGRSSLGSHPEHIGLVDSILAGDHSLMGLHGVHPEQPGGVPQ